MRLTTSLIAILAIPLAIASCSDTSSLTVTPKDMAVAPPAPDLAVIIDMAVKPDFAKPPVDMAYTPMDANGVGCGNMTCAPGDSCCVSNNNGMVTGSCAKTCDADAGAQFALQCDGPEDCNQNPCCVDIKGMNPPKNTYCTMKSTDCSPNINTMTFQGMTRFCHVDADCTRDAPQGNLQVCCTGSYSGQKQHICFDPGYAQFTQGAITCP